ncbi:site-specific integrase [Bacillus marinisedimentorum]|uniref:site-specific integrase n=1 Tax=Bacillus marinisedimentorum TaxID=1821260 RepID=UPI0008730989|nr:site-specific integrase [Bacillus marinisedimentorum]
MKGSIKKNKATGKWDFIVDVGKDPKTGRRKQKRKRGFHTKREAENALASLLNELNNGTFIEPTKLTVNEFFEEWLKERLSQVSRHTYKTHTSLYKHHIQPLLGGLELCSINSSLLQKYVNELVTQTDLHVNSIRKVVSLLKLGFAKAKRLGLIQHNPVTNIDMPREVKPNLGVWTIEETQKFLQYTFNYRYYIAYLLAINTGMRKGEILGLRWRDINFEENIIYINQILEPDGKVFKSGAKTSSGVRSIHISRHLLLQLKKEKVERNQERLKIGSSYNDNDLVVCTKYGNPVDPPSFSKRFKELSAKAGLPVIRFHDLRHTHATMLIQQNVNPKVISERLGHSNIQITLNLYSHVLPSMQQDVADKLDKLFDL